MRQQLTSIQVLLNNIDTAANANNGKRNTNREVCNA